MTKHEVTISTCPLKEAFKNTNVEDLKRNDDALIEIKLNKVTGQRVKGNFSYTIKNSPYDKKIFGYDLNTLKNFYSRIQQLEPLKQKKKLYIQYFLSSTRSTAKRLHHNR